MDKTIAKGLYPGFREALKRRINSTILVQRLARTGSVVKSAKHLRPMKSKVINESQREFVLPNLVGRAAYRNSGLVNPPVEMGG